MSDLLGLSDEQMQRIAPYFHCRTVFRAWMIGGSSAGSSS